MGRALGEFRVSEQGAQEALGLSQGYGITQEQLNLDTIMHLKGWSIQMSRGLIHLKTVWNINRASVKVPSHKFSPVSQLVRAQLSINRFLFVHANEVIIHFMCN